MPLVRKEKKMAEVIRAKHFITENQRALEVLKKEQSHNPDEVDYEVKPLLHLVEDILRHAAFNSEGVSTDILASIDHVHDKVHHPNYLNTLETLSKKVYSISCKISYDALCGFDQDSTTLYIFGMLTNYKWDVKMVLTLSALALSYGEFWLLAHMFSSNQLSKSIAIQKQLYGIMEHSNQLKPMFDSLSDLIKVILEVTKCVIEFSDIKPEASEYYRTVSSYIPKASYWSVRGVVASATQIISLITMGNEFKLSTREYSKLSALSEWLKSILEDLRNNLDSYYRDIEKRKDEKSYETLRELFKMNHTENIEVFKALIYAKDDILPLFDGSAKKRVSLDVLRSKDVLLLISDPEYFSHHVLLILGKIYNESRILENKYELVWIPRQRKKMTEQQERQFGSLQVTMPWYSVDHPSMISKEVIWFIQREWKYKNKPILVVVDREGKVACPNAIHMMWIWGSSAFPFTSSREESLWRDETWRLELLVDDIDSEILNWIREGKYIFLYGGDDVEWVKTFMTEARRVAQAAHISLEMLYVGKSNYKSEQVQRVLHAINLKKLNTQSWRELSIIWFWIRIENMLFSKIQLKQANDNDLVTQEIKNLLSYDKLGGCMILARGSNIVVNGHAITGLRTLMEYQNRWRENVENEGFDVAFEQHYQKLHEVAKLCCRFELSDEVGRIAEELRCPECQRQMNTNILTTLQCCHDEDPYSAAMMKIEGVDN